MRRALSTDERDGPSLLVAQTSFLGDVVLTTPLLDALRARIRPRRLSVMVRPDAVPLLEGHPAVDDLIVDDKRGANRGVAGMIRQARRLRAEAFDVVVSPHRSLRTALVLAAARIPRRVGFDASRGFWLFHERVHRPTERHDVERNLALLEAFGGWSEPPRLHVPVRPEAARAAEGLLAGRSAPIVGVAPGSVWATKRWTEGGFADLVCALHDDGMEIVLLGAADDQARAHRIAAAAGVPVTDLTGRTDLATFVAVVDRLGVLVANDSAPMHVAVARGVPVVAVFCATTPALGFGPYGQRAVVVEADLACRPCARHGGPTCPRGTDDCRHLVEAATLRVAVHRMLEAA
jgi:heptosyltransferase-2